MSQIEELLTKAKARLQSEVLDIESRTDLTADEKVSRIIVIFSSVCAGIAIQPIPFADIFILTPIQAFMGARISAIRGIPLAEKDVTEVLKEIAGVVGLGLLAQQLVIGAYKTFLPFLGGFMTIPVVFGLTYAIGQVMDQYFIRRAKGERMNKEEIKKAWERAKKAGEAEGKRRKSEIGGDEL